MLEIALIFPFVVEFVWHEPGIFGIYENTCYAAHLVLLLLIVLVFSGILIFFNGLHGQSRGQW